MVKKVNYNISKIITIKYKERSIGYTEIQMWQKSRSQEKPCNEQRNHNNCVQKNVKDRKYQFKL